MSLFGGKKKKGAKYSKDQEQVAESLKLAMKAERDASMALREELGEVKSKLDASNAQNEELRTKLKDLQVEFDTLNEVVSSEEGNKKTWAEIQQARKDRKETAHKLKKQKKKFSQLKHEKEAECREKDRIISLLRQQVDRLLVDKNALEKKLAALNKGPALREVRYESLEEIAESARKIYAKRLDVLACHKDLPRLCKSFQVFDLNGNRLGGGEQDKKQLQNIRAILVSVARHLDGPELAKRVDERYGEYLKEGRDLIKALYDFLYEIVGEDSKVVSVLRAANQSIIAPTVVFLTNRLEDKFSFNSQKSGWSISVLVGDSVIMVTHKRKEQSSPSAEEEFGPFKFEWVLDFVFNRDMQVVKAVRPALTSFWIENEKKRSKVEGWLNDVFDELKEPLRTADDSASKSTAPPAATVESNSNPTGATAATTTDTASQKTSTLGVSGTPSKKNRDPSPMRKSSNRRSSTNAAVTNGSPNSSGLSLAPPSTVSSGVGESDNNTSLSLSRASTTYSDSEDDRPSSQRNASPQNGARTRAGSAEAEKESSGPVEPQESDADTSVAPSLNSRVVKGKPVAAT